MKFLHRHEDAIQFGTAALAAALMALWLHTRGWHWLQWLPAAFLTCFGVGIVWIVVWFARRKMTYEQMAARTRADLHAGGDGWPNARGQRSEVRGQKGI
jgi:hypothetical protein